MAESKIDRLEREFLEFRDTYNKDINWMTVVMAEFTQMREMLHSHDKRLIRGNGVPSLEEQMRTLTKTVNDYIETKKAEEESKRIEASKIRLAIVAGIVIPLVWSVIQGGVLIFRIYPLLEALSK